MSSTEVQSRARDAGTGSVDMKLEVQIIPVSDVDRSRQFYERLGWRASAGNGGPCQISLASTPRLTMS